MNAHLNRLRATFASWLPRVPCAAALAVALLFSGCSSDPVRDLRAALQSKGEPQLQAGIKLYEDRR